MATVEPFQGIRYNPQKITSMAVVVTPPYDVITDAQQSTFYERSPFNVIRIELGRPQPDDDQNKNPHQRAQAHLQAWQAQEVLIRDLHPSFYLVSTRYNVAQETFTRWGLIAQVGLEPFSARGHILPHEKTFPQIKSERLGLMRACGMNTSPIFALFDDQGGLMARLQSQTGDLAATLDFDDEDGARHRMWRLVDPDLNANIQAAFANQRLYIADGHHRYETCLAYRDECARRDRHFSDRHPANATLMYISSMQDPGLQVLPTHRALPQVDADLKARFIERAHAYFDCQTMAIGHDEDAATAQLCQALEAMPAEEGLGVVIQGDARLHLLRLKPDAARVIYATDVPPPLQQLNVTLLSEFVLPELLGMGNEKLEDARSIHFRHNARATVAAVRRGDYDMAFILEATPVQQVRKIAEAGLSMPRKTTYFAPKVITGLVMRGLAPAT
jgi:uncharacterized protein (DUF1015 family)